MGRDMPFGSLLLTLIAVAVTGYFSYRYLATQAAEAEIAAVRPYCELVTCSWGKCNRRERLACHDVPATLKPEQHVRRFHEARVEFVGSDGQFRAAWVEFAKLDKTGAKVGDRIAIHYIDSFSEEPEITPRPSLVLTTFGVAAFLVFLSFGARRMRSRWHADSA